MGEIGNMKKKLIITGIVLLILVVLGVFIYFKYFFTYEQKNIVKRKFSTITGQNLKITIYALDGKIIKTWHNVPKISSGKEHRDYTFFYTKNGKYVQIPNSIWYTAEEE